MALTDRQLKALKGQIKRFEVADAKGLSIRVNPCGTIVFQMRYRFHGKGYRFDLGTYPHTSLAEARDRHRAAQKVLDDGRNPIEDKRRLEEEKPPAWTLNQLADDFLTKKVARERRRPEYASYLLKSNVLNCIGNRKVKEISTREIVVTLEKISDRGRNVLANRTASIVKQMFNYAVQRGLRDDNPCSVISKTTIGGRETPRGRFLSPEEIKRLWIGLDKSKIAPSMKIAAKLLLVTGQRRGELVRANWSHIDFSTATWKIPASLSKNAKPHMVALSPLALKLFEHLKALSFGSEYLFPSTRPDLNQPTDIRALNKALRHVTTALSIKGCSPHTLRHTFSTLASRIGIQPHIVEKILNHSLGGMLAVYNHEEYMEDRKQALNTWSEKLVEIVEGNGEESQSPTSPTIDKQAIKVQITTTKNTIPSSNSEGVFSLVFQQPYQVVRLSVPLQAHGRKS